MAFTNVVCWDPRYVRNVMNTSAEHAAPSVFLAVHSEIPLSVCTPGVGDPRESLHRQLEPSDFMSEFLSPGLNDAKVIVYGDSGSGKSHLIRWMSLNTPDSPDRYVISVPRTGVSLRGILELIVDVLPDEKASEYRAHLAITGAQDGSRDAMKNLLRVNLSSAIREDIASDELDPETRELEEALTNMLPDLLEDPELRLFFGKQGGVIEQFVDHVLSDSASYDQAEGEREFTRDSLPLSGVDSQKMSDLAQRAADVLRGDEKLQDIALGIINRNRDIAVGRVLNFSGDTLVRLINDVRRYLREQDKELVLFFEDLTRAQGLDRALMEALTDERGYDNGLCTLRWAIAVNRGYYFRIDPTQRTRLTHVVDIDWKGGGDTQLIDDDNLSEFASKYLNTARLTPQQLEQWFEQSPEDRGDPPIKCDDCEFQTDCHATFGSENGIGLYPFNKFALSNSLSAIHPTYVEGFNPRFLVKDVLAEVLGTYGPDLEQGQFPSGFLTRIRHLPTAVNVQLRRQNEQDAERLLAVLEVWGASTEAPTDLPAELYTAFGLTKPAIDGAVEVTITEHEHENQIANPISRDIQAIRDWGNGNSLLQDRVVNRLRRSIYSCLNNYIDWDGLGLTKASFTTRHFQRTYIRFRNQAQSERTASHPVSLLLPITDDPTDLSETTLALEGLLQFEENGSWEFNNGSDRLKLFANQLEIWSQHIVSQMKPLTILDPDWDPISSSVELLAVGSVLAGIPSRADTTNTDALNAIFEDWPQDPPAESPEWVALYQAIQRNKQSLIQVLNSEGLGNKGGTTGRFLNPNRIMPALQKIRQKWEFSNHPNQQMTQLRNDYGDVAKLYALVSDALPQAARAEWDRRTNWVEEWNRNFPEDARRRQIVDAITDLYQSALENAVGFSRSTKSAFEGALERINTVQLDEGISVANDLRESSDPLQNLGVLGLSRGSNAIMAVEDFLPAVRALVEEVNAWNSGRTATQGEDQREFIEQSQLFGRSLNNISQSLYSLEEQIE